MPLIYSKSVPVSFPSSYEQSTAATTSSSSIDSITISIADESSVASINKELIIYLSRESSQSFLYATHISPINYRKLADRFGLKFAFEEFAKRVADLMDEVRASTNAARTTTTATTTKRLQFSAIDSTSCRLQIIDSNEFQNFARLELEFSANTDRFVRHLVSLTFQLKKSVTKLTTDLNASKAEVERYRTENEALKTQLDSCRKAADDEIAKLQYDGDFLRSKIDEMERMHQVLRANFEALTEDSEEMESKFELELNQRNIDVKHLRSEISELQSEIDSLSAQLTDEQHECHRLRAIESKLLNEVEREKKTSDQALQFIKEMRNKEQQRKIMEAKAKDDEHERIADLERRLDQITIEKRELEEKYNAMRIEMEQQQQQPPPTTHNDKHITELHQNGQTNMLMMKQNLPTQLLLRPMQLSGAQLIRPQFPPITSNTTTMQVRSASAVAVSPISVCVNQTKRRDALVPPMALNDNQ